MALEFDTTDEATGAGPSSPAPELWHGIDQWMGSPEFQKLMKDEFPEDAPEWLDPVTRRQALKLMGASIALAGAIGCNPSLKPASNHKIIPYVNKPEAITPGVPLFFATAMSIGGYASGLLVKSHEGRPIKAEGNPSHPASLGSTDVFAQASVLGLYDPDRSKEVRYNGTTTTWEKAKSALLTLMTAQKLKKGAGFRVLSEASTSPTIAALMAELKLSLPEMKWLQYEPIGRENANKGIKLAFGEYANAVYHFEKADVILSLEADFLGTGVGGVRYARDAMSRRKVRIGHDKKSGDGVTLNGLSRIYAIESMTTGTGGVADHRLPLKPSEIESFLRELAKELGVAGTPAAGTLPANAKVWIKPVAADLKKAGAKAAIIAGDSLSAVAHALVHAIHAKLGAIGTTIAFTETVQTGLNGPDADSIADGPAALKTLTEELKGGKVEVLFVFGGNPAFNAPADFAFADALKASKAVKVHVGAYHDETGVLCDWHINEAHYLEAWGDARSYEGTVSIQQPLIAPLHGAKTVLEVLATMLNKAYQTTLGLVQETHSNTFVAKKLAGTFDSYWHKSVETGVVADSAAAIKKVELKLSDAVAKSPAPATKVDEIELQFRADPTLFDGRFANNGWLQETPKPITLLTWDNAAIVSPATAEKLKCEIAFKWTAGEHGRSEVDMIELKVGTQILKVAVWILPGHADDVITLHVGYGREKNAGTVAMGTGFNAYKLRNSTGLWLVPGIKPLESAKRTEEKYILACTQGQHAMEGRRPARHGTLEQARAEKKAIDNHTKHAFDFADNPPASAAEKGLMRSLLPGTPEERERLAITYKEDGYKNNQHRHEKDEGHKDHEHIHDARLLPLTLVDDHKPNKLYRRWAMAIDLGACTGCNACITACVSENNVPVIGKVEVTRGRIMHWIRLDRYFAIKDEVGGTKRIDDKDRWEALKASTSEVTTHFQPVNCQQCEKAPCELVCPVGATVHSADGLNDMAYNRCVGTRYCANNCPYKVRRFNFIQYANYDAGTTTSLMNNPEVTIRTRGVMEKCTYCVQRIRNAEIEAEREHDNPGRLKDERSKRPIIKDGEIKTACQSACPSQAIAFGDLNYDQYEVGGKSIGFSEVSRWKLEPTHYGLLAELNTMPRTTYLAAIKNPNPELKGA